MFANNNNNNNNGKINADASFYSAGYTLIFILNKYNYFISYIYMENKMKIIKNTNKIGRIVLFQIMKKKNFEISSCY